MRDGGIGGASATALALALAVNVAGCGGPAGAADAQAPVAPVGVVTVTPQQHVFEVQLTGRVSAFQVSEVRPQVGGIVRSRRFEEGAKVRAGQMLYEIDAGPARAQLASAQAVAASSGTRYERYQELVGINAVSRQELDDARASANQAAAALDSARINLAYTRVTAPIDGVIGASSVTPGALATPAQAEPFAVIQNIDRVYVDMTQSSADMMQLRRALAESGDRHARVRLVLQDRSEYQHEGRLEFSDVSVNESTGTVRLRAIFPNPDHLLLPGMFVQARLIERVDPDAILAPQQGITRNARGDAVALVLNKENVVEQRTLQTGPTAGENWVVLAGLNAGDRLIVDGLQRVRPGAKAAPIDIEAERRAAQAQRAGRGG